jgi:hypothetical protein
MTATAAVGDNVVARLDNHVVDFDANVVGDHFLPIVAVVAGHVAREDREAEGSNLGEVADRSVRHQTHGAPLQCRCREQLTPDSGTLRIARGTYDDLARLD